MLMSSCFCVHLTPGGEKPQEDAVGTERAAGLLVETRRRLEVLLQHLGHAVLKADGLRARQD